MYRHFISFFSGIYVAQEYNFPRIKPTIIEYTKQIEKWLDENKKSN